MHRSSFSRLSAVVPRRRKQLLAVVAASVLIAGYAALPAFAVHDQTFQLDGDVSAATTTSVGGTTQTLDWDSIFTAAGANQNPLPTGFTAAKFDRDFLTNANGTFNTTDDTTFATGSKDTLPITPGWQCNHDANVNSKIDIMNAYSTAYTAPNGDSILYFALERNSNAGDGNVGFWFLQDSTVGCSSTSGNAAFTGNHTDGDLLIVSAFTNGGSVSNVAVYRWNGGANGSLGTTAVAGGGDCKTQLGGNADVACATVNSPANGTGGTITTPWLTSNKQDGPGHSLRTSEFFEGGLNLTKANLGGKCFNVFIGDTRSSQSLTATLFDFARGQLGECAATITTTPSLTTTSLGDTGPITDLADVSGKNSSGGTGPTPTGTVTFFLCGPGVTNCNTGGTQVGNAVPLGACTPPAAGHACATSGDVRSLVTAGGVGMYCFRGVYDPGNDPNYQASAGVFDGSSTECFTVTAVASTTTTQKWLPQDSAHVTASGGATVAGTVTFKLYESTDCSGTAVQTFADIPVDSSGNATTNNATYYVDTNIQISWRATFTSSNSVGSGNPSPCERSDIANLDDDISN
jgi:hypothetical protein